MLWKRNGDNRKDAPNPREKFPAEGSTAHFLECHAPAESIRTSFASTVPRSFGRGETPSGLWRDNPRQTVSPLVGIAAAGSAPRALSWGRENDVICTVCRS